MVATVRRCSPTTGHRWGPSWWPWRDALLEWPPMPLNDVAIRAAKPGPKPVKLSDERGLFLLVQPSGGKLWRLKYRIAGKEKKLSLGRYPDVALKEARERSAEACKLIAAGVDPLREEARRSPRRDAEGCQHVHGGCERVHCEIGAGRSGRCYGGQARWLLSLLEPALGTRPIDEISPVELLAALRKVEARGHLETARRMRSLASRVFATPSQRDELPPIRPPRCAVR